MSVLVDALLGSSVAGSSAPSVTRSVWSSARSAAADADAEADALGDASPLGEPLGVSALAAALAAVLAAALGAAALGAVDVGELPHAAAMIATVPSIPISRFFTNIWPSFHGDRRRGLLAATSGCRSSGRRPWRPGMIDRRGACRSTVGDVVPPASLPACVIIWHEADDPPKSSARRAYDAPRAM